MLNIVILGEELFNEETSTFNTVEETSLNLEHSLYSISKWEAVFEKPFLGNSYKTDSDILKYIEFMIETPVFKKDIINYFSSQNLEEVNTYINSRQTATTFGTMPGSKSRGEVITSELIYYWMVTFNIPFECERWHINRLFALIQICNIKNSKQKKIPRNEIAQRNRDLNEQRKAQLNTTG